jgi:hypothetical protein
MTESVGRNEGKLKMGSFWKEGTPENGHIPPVAAGQKP